MPWLSQSLTAAQKSQQTIKAVYFQHRFYSTASTIGYRALLWRLYMPGWRHHQYPLNFSHLSEAKLTFSHLHFSGEVNQSQSVVELTWITVIMAAVVKSPSFPLWKSTRHLQQWSWLQLPSEVKLTSPSVVKSTEHTFISVMKANQAPSAVKMASITFRGEAHFTFSSEVNWTHLHFHDESQPGTFSREDGFNHLQR